MRQKHFPRGHTQSDELPDKGKLSGYISLEMKIIKRLLQINLPRGKSAFLGGPRKVGKTYLISHTLKGVEIIDILEDTYLGFRIPPWKKSKDRRMILAEKFYLFDVGVANYLSRHQPKIGSPEFGKAFEHYILMELKAYQAYRNPELPIAFWRTSTGREVDFIVGDKELAIEVKGSSRVHEGDIRSLKALVEDGPVKRCCIVCMEKQPRQLATDIEAIPWKMFVEQLWAGTMV